MGKGSINWDSIFDKAKKRMSDHDMQKRIDWVIDKVILNFSSSPGSPPAPSEAAKKFIEVLQAEIRSHAGMEPSVGGLGATAVTSLTQLSHGEPVKVGRSSYQISVSFDDNLHRESLYPKGYPEGVDNIAALLNSGYDAGKRVYGVWHGNKIHSLTHRDGTHFIESAIRTFMADYASKYGVVGIEVDDVYK